MAGGFPLMPSVFEQVSGYPLLGFTRDPKPEKAAKVLKNYGEPAGTRTQDPRLKRAMLYQLSYRLTERRARIVPPTLSLCLDRNERRPFFGLFSLFGSFG